MTVTTSDLLNHVMVERPDGYATVDEYAAATGLTVEQVLEAMQPALTTATLRLDPVGDAMFVHTAPAGRRPATAVPANLWEHLRLHGPEPVAYTRWRLIRQMEHAGWQVTANPEHTRESQSHSHDHPVVLGLYVHNRILPLLDSPDPDEFCTARCPLTRLDARGARAFALTCHNGELAHTVTSVRHWLLSRARRDTAVFVLEAPRYGATLLRQTDSSVTPISVTQGVPASF